MTGKGRRVASGQFFGGCSAVVSITSPPPCSLLPWENILIVANVVPRSANNPVIMPLASSPETRDYETNLTGPLLARRTPTGGLLCLPAIIC